MTAFSPWCATWRRRWPPRASTPPLCRRKASLRPRTSAWRRSCVTFVPAKSRSKTNFRSCATSTSWWSSEFWSWKDVKKRYDPTLCLLDSLPSGEAVISYHTMGRMQANDCRCVLFYDVSYMERKGRVHFPTFCCSGAKRRGWAWALRAVVQQPICLPREWNWKGSRKELGVTIISFSYLMSTHRLHRHTGRCCFTWNAYKGRLANHCLARLAVKIKSLLALRICETCYFFNLIRSQFMWYVFIARRFWTFVYQFLQQRYTVSTLFECFIHMRFL